MSRKKALRRFISRKKESATAPAPKKAPANKAPAKAKAPARAPARTTRKKAVKAE